MVETQTRTRTRTSTTHLDDLRKEVLAIHSQYPKGVPIRSFQPVAERKDSPDVFSEGENFAGLARRGGAQACLTLVASPHVPATVEVDRMIRVFEQVGGSKVTVPETVFSPKLSPQLIVWWEHQAVPDPARCDFIEASRMSSPDRHRLYSAVEDQVIKGVRVIEEVRGTPLIWGSWGHADRDERMVWGGNRGAPTNPLGHCHLTYFGEVAPAAEIPTVLDRRDILDFYAPWNRLLMRKFGSSLANILSRIGAETHPEVDFRVTEYQLMSGYGSKVRQTDAGLALDFNTPVQLATAFNLLTTVAGKFESLYQDLVSDYEGYHLARIASGRPEKYHSDMQDKLLNFGFSRQDSVRLSDFALAVRPTLTQLLRWEKEMWSAPPDLDTTNKGLLEIQSLIGRYRLVAQRLAGDGSDCLWMGLIADTVKEPNQCRGSELTMPAHASWWYLIDDYRLNKNELLIKSLKLFPALITTKAGPEKLTGSVIKRVMAKS